MRVIIGEKVEPCYALISMEVEDPYDNYVFSCERVEFYNLFDKDDLEKLIEQGFDAAFVLSFNAEEEKYEPFKGVYLEPLDILDVVIARDGITKDEIERQLFDEDRWSKYLEDEVVRELKSI